jgi:N-acetylglucosaminyldiphosphoundecaprenol N-acetyl-beta-D-mannosaminyltransferase
MHAFSYRGLQVHVGTRAEAREALLRVLEGSTQHQVITVNPEFVVLAARNPALRALTHQATLCLVDGVGLSFALRRYGTLERYPGADMVPDLLRYCAAHQKAVGVVLSNDGLSTSATVVAKLAEQFPGLRIAAWDEQENFQEKIKRFAPDLLLVTFGQPRQDFWLAENMTSFQSVRMAIGVGGAIDFLTGARRRAPRLMRSLGLEWLWRLVTQPRRFVRIFRATFGFWYTILCR